MRGGRNKFGPMYKRDRARKLQVLRQRQVFTGHNGLVMGGYAHHHHASAVVSQSNSVSSNSSYTSPLHIKQEIQIPQVTSMTSSPDSSPSPVQLGTQNILGAANMGSGGNGGNGGGSSVGQIVPQQTDPSTGGVQWQISTTPNNGNSSAGGNAGKVRKVCETNKNTRKKSCAREQLC